MLIEKPVTLRHDVVFMDEVNIFSISVWLVKVGLKSRECKEIRYFNSTSLLGRTCIGFLKACGLFSTELRKIEYFLGELRDDEGKALFYNYYHLDINRLCDDIIHHELENNPFLQKLCGCFTDRDRLLIYLKKQVFNDILEKGIHVNVVADQIKGIGEVIADYRFLYLVEFDTWNSQLGEYAGSKGGHLLSYPRLPNLKWRELIKLPALSLKFSPRVLVAELRGYCKRLLSKGGSPEGATCSAKPCLSIAYTGRGVSDDPADRNDFFWWWTTDISPNNILLYFIRADLPLTAEMAQSLRAKGIHFIVAYHRATSVPDVPMWQATWDFYKVSSGLGAKIGKLLLGNMVHCGWRVFAYMRYLSVLIFEYSYWFDFFKTNEIKLNINFAEFSSPDSIGSIMALQDLGGLNIAYQLSSLNFGPINVVPTSNVVFSFSHSYPNLWAPEVRPTENYVPTGYLYDSAFKVVGQRARVIRGDLLKKGVEFVIAFCDENSSNNRNSIFSEDDGVAAYRILLERLLDDEKLGLVCKPKVGRTLYKRLDKISDLLEEAMKTERLIILDRIDILPAEASLASDICIGDLMGATASLEAYLTGTPSVLVDTIDMYDHPYYKWGKDKVVFNSWEAMLRALDQYRKSPDKMPGFGDWSPAIDELDPFRDGLAGNRIGEYISTLLASVKSGGSSELALQRANGLYGEKWDRDKLILSARGDQDCRLT
jgi:hypothetical protein